MQLKVLPHRFSVCKVNDAACAYLNAPFCFFAKTDEEISLVCPTDYAPPQTLAREDGWRAFRIEGVLDFSLIGILAKISGILAAQGIGLFAVSTYNTDYILVKEENLQKALQALENDGYSIAE